MSQFMSRYLAERNLSLKQFKETIGSQSKSGKTHRERCAAQCGSPALAKALTSTRYAKKCKRRGKESAFGHEILVPENLIIGGVGIVHGKVPVDGMFQFGLVDWVRNPGHLATADRAADADKSGVEGFWRGSSAPMALLPMLKLVQKVTVAVDGGEHFQQRHIMSLGEEIL
jgi:hypothetical protein